MWGSLIDQVCSKYHWTFDYVMWGISYQNLMMMLTDTMVVYSDFEKKSLENTDSEARDNSKMNFGQFISAMKEIKNG